MTHAVDFVLTAGSKAKTLPYAAEEELKTASPGAFNLLFGLALIAFALVFFFQISPGTYSGLVLFGCGGIVLVFLGSRAVLAERLIRPITVDIAPNPRRLGDVISADIRFTTSYGVRLLEMTATVRCDEKWGKGDDSGTENVVLLSKPLVPRSAIRAGELSVLGATFKIPVNAPTTFMAEHNRVDWTLEITLNFVGWLKWKHSMPFVVHPKLKRQTAITPVKPGAGDLV